MYTFRRGFTRQQGVCSDCSAGCVGTFACARLALLAMSSASLAGRPPLAAAHKHSDAAEEFIEDGRWLQAAECLEQASEAFVAATLLTTDSDCVQSLRLLASAHAQRAHELRMRAKLCGLQQRDSREDAGAQSGGRKAPTADDSTEARGREVAKQAASEAPEATLAVSGAFARLSSQLIYTHEELRFGAEELARILLPVGPAQCASASPSGAMGGSTLAGAQKLIDSFCIVPSHRSPSGSVSSRFGEPLATHLATHALQSSVAVAAGGSMGGSDAAAPASSAGAASDARAASGVGAAGVPIGASASGAAGASVSASVDGSPDGGSADGLRASLAALAVENGRLSRENAAIRQRASEHAAIFAKAQRRAADQHRLARKALAALREVHATPRPELDPTAAKEIVDLRRQLEAAHTARRQQAELVRKYELRWAQLKASARRKQAQQAQQPQQQPPPLQSHSSPLARRPP